MYPEECGETDRTVHAQTEPRLVPAAWSARHGSQSSLQVGQLNNVTLVAVMSAAPGAQLIF